MKLIRMSEKPVLEPVKDHFGKQQQCLMLQWFMKMGCFI